MKRRPVSGIGEGSNVNRDEYPRWLRRALRRNAQRDSREAGQHCKYFLDDNVTAAEYGRLLARSVGDEFPGTEAERAVLVGCSSV